LDRGNRVAVIYADMVGLVHKFIAAGGRVMITYILVLIFLIILLLPMLVKRVEHNLELFLLVVGSVTLLFSHLLGPERLISARFVEAALLEPVKLTIATLVFGLVFRAVRDPLKKMTMRIEARLGPRLFAFLLIFLLGVVSSVITAIIAALVLCEIVSAINLDKKYETRLVIFACFSIGMGAALTPIGEPLSTIAVAKLRGGALDGDFFMLLRTLGAYIVPGLLLVSLAGGFFRGTQVSRSESLTEDSEESFAEISLRAFKVYVFVMALVLLGTGFKPMIDMYISKMPAPVLYWVNITSAILDNATLAAAELGPVMSVAQVKGIIMGIIISGGMLIPGNIPNIIAANKLKISSREWATVGAPFGFVLMAVSFAVLYW
jgi:predicted cation transporter